MQRVGGDSGDLVTGDLAIPPVPTIYKNLCANESTRKQSEPIQNKPITHRKSNSAKTESLSVLP